MIRRPFSRRPNVITTPIPVPFSENDPNLRVYGPEGEVDPIQALNRERRHQAVRDLQRRGLDKQEIAERLKITDEEVEESRDPKIPERPPRNPRISRPRPQ